MTARLIPILLISAACFAQYPPGAEIKQNQLVTWGLAHEEFAADRAELRATFSGLGSSYAKAVDDLAPKLERTLARLGSLGIRDDQIETSRFNAGANTGESSWWTSSRDFKVQADLKVTVDDLEKLDPVVRGLLEQPLDGLTPIFYSLSDADAKAVHLTRAAAQNARETAEVLAKTLGATIVRALYIENQDMTRQLERGLAVTATSAFIVSSLHKIEMRASVRVVFELGYPQ